MIKKSFVAISALVIFSISTSFAQMKESRVDIDYGTSYKLQKYNQILDPDAYKNPDPVYGLDGDAAKETMKSYREQFKPQEDAPVYQFTIGGESKK